MTFASELPLVILVVMFLAAAAVVGTVGVRLAAHADRLADQSGLGEAMIGAVFLGATTSLAGSVTSIVAAVHEMPDLAIGNALGGIAAQTAFLGAADIAYRRANLEHAAASLENLVHGALLVSLLAVPLVAMSAPEFSVLGVHPASFFLVVAYLFGLRIVTEARNRPMWGPRMTQETRVDRPDEPRQTGVRLLATVVTVLFLAVLVAGAGYVLAVTGAAISGTTGLSETAVGAVLTAVATSLPELVTTVAAVRRGALTLAVSGILGGNTFDVLFVAFSDVAYREGSIYHVLAPEQTFLVALGILLTGILLLGLLRRERHGVWNIGFESFLVLVLYGLGVTRLAWSG